MGKSLLSLTLSLLLLEPGCAGNRLERKLFTNPVAVNIGRYENDVGELESAIKTSKNKIEKTKYKLYDVVEGCRGDMLAENLMGKIPSLQEEELLFVVVGAGHINSFYLKLKNKFNVYFFSEVPYLETKDSFLKLSPFLFAQYSRKPENQKLDKRLNAVVYGDSHPEDFDFRNYFPSIQDFKEGGFKRIVFAYELLETSGEISLDSFKQILESEGRIPKMKTFLDYLSEAEKAGIGVGVVGFGKNH